MISYDAADPAALLELADYIERNGRADDVFQVNLAGSGYARHLQAWNAEVQRLNSKMFTPPRIRVSRNHANALQHQLITDREDTMGSNLIEAVRDTVSGWFRTAPRPAQQEPDTWETPIVNILYSAFSDVLAEHNQIIGGFKKDIKYIVHTEIVPLTPEACSFIESLNQYGDILEKGAVEYIRKDSCGQWSLIKPSNGMTVTVRENSTPSSSGQSSDFMINFTWAEAAQAFGDAGKKAAAGKKTLPFPVKVTIDNGGTPVVEIFNEVPCRGNRQEKGSTEISLEGSATVSRTHFTLDYRNGELALYDLGSKHGSFVDGKDLRQNAGKKQVIKPGSSTTVVLCLGNSPEQVAANSRSTDRKSFPRVTIEYGTSEPGSGTPELGSGTPELVAAGNW